jgi:putative heme-binding domain-containing protein
MALRVPPSAALAALFVLAAVGSADAQLLNQDHPGQYSQEDIATGARVYSVQCNQCHGRDGDQVSGVDLRRRIFRRSSSDEDLAKVITSGTPGGMPPFRLQPAELTGVVGYIRSGFDSTGSITLGDAARGRAIYDGKGECSTCHRIAGKGPRLAPDLSDIGLARGPAALERSVRNPSAAMWPINRPVRVVLKDGRTVSGRRLNEDTATVQILDDQERLVSVAKRDVRTLNVATTSPMPAYSGRLTDTEIADLVAYLLTLREP